MLGLDLNGWEAVVVWSLGIAAVAALAILTSTRVVILLQREAMRESDGALKKYQAAAELKTAEAIGAAAKANERAADLERQAAELRKEAESAKAEAAKANERILEMKRMRRLEKPQADALGALLKSHLFQSEPKPILVPDRKGVLSKVAAFENFDIRPNCN